jgi:hypothetical protein
MKGFTSHKALELLSFPIISISVLIHKLDMHFEAEGLSLRLKIRALTLILRLMPSFMIQKEEN